jgi:hypothetical protein
VPAERSDVRSLVILALLAGRAFATDCPQGQTQASCSLHDEGVTAFTARKYDEAATKFRAAIAAGATARSYLGYAQSVEGQGKIALAYETMLVAQKLSNEEMARPGGAQDTAIVGRAERIKYKLAELGAKIAYAWFRLPEGVPVRRLVSVFREGEGDLRDPIGRWIVVAPDRQVMFATLDDGQRIQVIAQVAAGAQGTVIIPVRATTAPQIQPITPAIQPSQVYQPIYVRTDPPPAPPATPKGPAVTVLALDGAFVTRNDDNVAFGLGFGAQFERKLAHRMALVARGSYIFHPSETATFDVDERTTSATEGMLSVGVRTRSKLPLYAGAEVGALFYTQHDESPLGVNDYEHTYPALLAGGGVRIGKMHFEIYSLVALNTGERDLPARFFFTFGFDLYRQ